MKLSKLSFNLLFVLALLFAGKASAQCPAVTLQPINAVVCEGVDTQFITFTSNISGAFFAWQVNDGINGWVNITGAPYSGFATTNLRVVGSPASLSGFQYRCRVDKASCPTVYTQPATLTVNTAPFVATSPIDSQICQGSAASYTAEASGGGLSYVWQRYTGTAWVDLTNGAPYSGVTSKTLLVNNPALTLNGSFFRVKVSGQCSPITFSDSAKLTINLAPEVSIQPTGASECIGGNAKFSMSATGTTLTYQWQENQGSGWNDIPGALPYSGVYSNQLEILGITAAMNNRQYRCVVKGKCSPPDTTNVVQLIAKTAPAVASVTDLDTICEGENASITVIASGSNLQYQWQENKGGIMGFVNLSDGGMYAGTHTDKLIINGVGSSFEGTTYRCMVTGDCPPLAYSAIREMHVIQDKSVIDNPRDTAVVVDGFGYFAVSAVGTAISYQWQVDNGQGFQSISDNHPNYDGVNTDTLKLKYTPFDFNGYHYRCLVYGGCNEVPAASTGAVLTMQWPTSVATATGNTDGITIYPNPATGNTLFVNVKNAASQKMNVRIVDNMGRTLSNQAITLDASNTSSIDIRTIPAGIYSVILADEQFNTVKTITFTKK